MILKRPWGTEDPAVSLPSPACRARKATASSASRVRDGCKLDTAGVVGHMLGQQAVEQAVGDVGGSRQLGYQGVPLIHDHSTMDARSLPRERTPVSSPRPTWDNSTAGAVRVGIDRVLLEAMGVHARAAAATGQLAMSELAMLELVVSEEECCDVLSARTDGSLWHQGPGVVPFRCEMPGLG